MEILATFALSLAFTLLIETIIALLFGIRMQGMKVVWLVNALTNPAAGLTFLLLSRVFPHFPADFLPFLHPFPTALLQHGGHE